MEPHDFMLKVHVRSDVDSILRHTFASPQKVIYAKCRFDFFEKVICIPYSEHKNYINLYKNAITLKKMRKELYLIVEQDLQRV